MDCKPVRPLCPWDSSKGKNTVVGCHAVVQGIFLIHGSNLSLLYLLHCRQVLYYWATGNAPYFICYVVFKSGCPGVSVVENLPANAEDAGSIPGLGRFPGEGNDNLLWYSCLGNPVDRGAWWATVHEVAKSWTRLSNWAHTVLKSTDSWARWLTLPLTNSWPGQVTFLGLIFLSSKMEMIMLQEGGPLPGPEIGLLPNTRKWIVRGDTCAEKARDFIGKGHPGREQ